MILSFDDECMYFCLGQTFLLWLDFSECAIQWFDFKDVNTVVLCSLQVNYVELLNTECCCYIHTECCNVKALR